MYTRIDNILREMRLKVRKLFDMYKTLYAEKATVYFCLAHCIAHVFGPLHFLRFFTVGAKLPWAHFPCPPHGVPQARASYEASGAWGHAFPGNF
jgi:hypothetical protein